MSFAPTAGFGTNPSASSSFSYGDGHGGAPRVAPREPIPQESLALRSCDTCRRRRVRCDKRKPCSTCGKAGIQCIFPPPDRAARKTRRPPAENTELLSRLRKLENIVETAITKCNTLVTPSPQQRSDHSSGEPSTQAKNEGDYSCPMTLNRDQSTPPEHEFGRLATEDDQSRYVSNRFWASLGDEIEELQNILGPSSSDDDEHSSPESESSYSAALLWQIYAENVKPLLPVVYGPHAQQLFSKAASAPDALGKNNESLVLAMYFAAIVSTSNEQCMAWLGESRDTLVRLYRFAVEQALSKAGLLDTQCMTLMQLHDDSKFVWSMSALILRLAQGLGLHRDGNNFGLRPFDTEMRRRLWWLVVLLDLRSSEDHGTDVQIHDRMFDTRFPLNVNDNDIRPDMEEQPKPRVGFTDMSFFLIRCDICYALRQVAYNCPKPSGGVGGHTPGICGNIIQIVNRHIEDQYLNHCDMADPIQWFSATVARLALTKMWLVIHLPISSSDHGSHIGNEFRESLFITSIEVAEFALLIKEDENTRKWSWMFDTHMQWHAIAMVLSELCVRPLSPLTDRAWLAVTSLYDNRLQNLKPRKGMLWLPLAQLMKRARALRAIQVAELRASVENQWAAAQNRIPASPGSNRPSIGSPFSTHFPEHSRLVAAAPSMDWGPSQRPLDFNSEGPVNIINHPPTEENRPATAESRGPTALQAAQNPNSSMSMSNEPAAGVPQGLPYSGVDDQEWDQLLQDIQADMQGMQPNPMGDITGWIA
ncbi:hypothetical protein BDW75DRAFT_234071 [Aspergillus navahoensis]